MMREKDCIDLQGNKQMKTSSAIHLYKQTYIDTQFERTGLFKIIKEKYDCNTVLYPGSFGQPAF